MTASAATESLQAWAARVAPEYTAEQWRNAEAVAVDSYAHDYFEARALLAERDRVAAGLSPAALLTLRHAHGCTWERQFARLAKAGLLARKMSPIGNVAALTDFGREIARVLAGRGTR